jgi:hypothetical protein
MTVTTTLKSTDMTRSFGKHLYSKYLLILKLSPLVLYPLWYFSPLVRPFGVTWFSTEASDLNSFVEQFRNLGSANYFLNWSSEVYASWKDLLRVESIQNIVQYLFGWLVTPILGPVATLNFYLFIGMCSSGIVAYFLARNLGASTLVAMFSGLTVESLPWLRQNILFGTACVYLSVPGAIILLLLKTPMGSIRLKDLVRLSSFMAFAGLFYAYWFIFGIFIIIIWAICSAWEIKTSLLQLRPNSRIRALIVLGLAIIIFIAIFGTLLKFTRNEDGKPFGTYSIEEVLTNINTIRGLVTPDAFHLIKPAKIWTNAGDDQNYLGVFVSVFAFLRLIRLFRNHSLNQERKVAMIAITCFVAAMGRINFIGVEIPSLREYLRFFMPGIRQFSRLGLISQFLFVILAWKEIGDIAQRLKQVNTRTFLVVFSSILILSDLNPSSRRFQYEPPIRYAQVNSALRNQSNPHLLVSQNSEPDEGFFDAQLIRNKLPFYTSLSGGIDSFLAALVENRVTHILANVDNSGRSLFYAFIQDSVRINLDLPHNYFVPVSNDVLVQERDNFGSPVTREHSVRLVQIRGLTPSLSCIDCRQLAQFTADPPLEVVDPNLNRSYISANWSIRDRVVLRTESLPGQGQFPIGAHYSMNLQLIAPHSLENKAVRLQIYDNHGLREIEVTSAPSWITIDFDRNNEAVITSKDDCVLATSSSGNWGLLEGKPICFGIADFIVFSNN